MWHLKHQLIVSDWERKKNSKQWPISGLLVVISDG